MQEKKMVAMHKLLMIFLFPVKNMFIWMYIFSYYILYVNNNNAYIYLKIVHYQTGYGGEGGHILSSQLIFLVVSSSQISRGLISPQLKAYFI